MKRVAYSLLLLSLFISLNSTLSLAQTPSDFPLNAMQVILGSVDKTHTPACGGTSFLQKKIRFCPLVASCSGDKPFCVLRGETKGHSRSVKYSCVCAGSPTTILVTPTPTPSPTPKATPKPTPTTTVQGTRVTGKITIANSCCPGTIPGTDASSNCAPVAYVGSYLIAAEPGSERIQGTTNSAGEFSNSLAPGTYVLSVGSTPGTIESVSGYSGSTRFTTTENNVTQVTLSVRGNFVLNCDPFPAAQ